MNSTEIEIRFGTISKKEYDELLELPFDSEERSEQIIIDQNGKEYESNVETSSNGLKLVHTKLRNKKRLKVDQFGNVKVSYR